MRALALPVFVFLFAAAVPAPAAECRFNQPDSAVNGIRIADTESARRVLGAVFRDKLPKAEQDKDARGADVSLPYRRFASKDGTQELRLYIHYGDVLDSYNEMEVSFASRGRAPAPKLPFDEFMTQAGVQLNMSEAQLVSRLGGCFKRTAERGRISLEYKIDDEKHPLLRRAKMPLYSARYIFEAGRLVRFRFGFEYPRYGRLNSRASIAIASRTARYLWIDRNFDLDPCRLAHQHAGSG